MRELDIIRIIPGYACNLKCKYCFQLDKDKKPDFGMTEAGLKSILEVIKEQLVYKSIEILFYGGEVLLFWDRLKYIIEAAEKLEMNGNVPRFHLISNGRLLTSDIINFCNEHNVGICVSYDGINSAKVRGYDPMEKKALLYSVKKLSIHATFSAWNYPLDYVDSLNAFSIEYAKKNGHPPNINGDFIYDFHGIQKMDPARINKEINTIMDRYINYCNNPDDEYLSSYLLIRYMAHYIFQMGDPETEPMCNWRNVAYLTTDGQIILCSNSCKIIGKYEDDKNLEKCFEYHNPTPELRKSLCKDCNAWFLCRGGCSFMDNDTRIKNLCPIIKAGISPVIERIARSIK